MLLSEESHQSNISTEKEKQDDGDIRCPNCSWYFSSNTKPYILPCFHNLCDKCIQNLIEEKNPKCPICSKVFTHEETNPFQVNFAFLNLVTKILTNKIIFCKKCYKIFYWYEHYTICDQENFIEVDDIFNDIKNYCEKGMEILKMFNNDNDNVTKDLNTFNTFNTSLVKYKNEIMVLLSKLIHKIRKKNTNKIKKEVDKIFRLKEKNKLEFEFDYKEIKSKIINFLVICIEHNEYFDKKDILSVIEPYFSCMESNKESTYLKRNNEIIINNNMINQSPRCFNSSNNTISKHTKKIFKPQINYSCENTSYVNNIFKNPNQLQFLKTPTKKKIFFEKETSKFSKIKEKVFNKNKNLFNSPNIAKFNNKKYNNKENKELNKKEIESDEEFIDNFDDDYHEVNNNNNMKTEVDYKPEKFNKSRLLNKKNKIINIKDIFEKSLLQDSNSQKKLIIGLNEVKVISLKKKINKNMKLSIDDINKNKNKNNFNNPQENNLINNAKINNKNANIKIFHKKKINSISSINSLFSTEITKSTNISNKNVLKKNNENKMIKKTSPTNFLSSRGKNPCNISLRDLKINKINSKMIFLNHSNNTKKKKPFINTNNINNYFFELSNKKNIYINNLSSPNNNSMNKIFKNFNNIKDIVNNVNKFVKRAEYIGDNVDKNLNHNLNLLKKNISEDYTLLLDDVVNNFINVQRRFLFSFKNNTKFIILYDTEYNNFIPLDLSDILPDFPNFNSSMQFEFIEYNDHYLLFISGGNSRILKSKESPNHSNDTFIIINIKINIDINNKNKINYKKKYILKHKDKMPSGKSNHSIIFHNNNLYVIGGFDTNKKITNECFYFSYKEKKWYELPQLNNPRANGSLCIYNKSLLYIFRGRDNEAELNSIEYLNININNTSDKKWILINIVDYGYVWNKIYNSCTVVLDENKILIFGGEDENILYKESFLFDIKNNSIYRGMNLKIPAAFNSQGIYNNGKVYGFDFKNKNGDYEHKVHIFDIKSNIWTLINAGNNNNISLS